MDKFETKNGDKSAFACVDSTYVQEGLTKREYFAAKSMQGYVTGEFTAQAGMPFENMAKWSVEMADALIKELEN